MNRTRLAGPLAAICCLAAALGGVARTARAGSLSSSVLGMFPKNVAEIGYADVKTARESKWFPQFEAQVLPSRFTYFERFVSSAGMDLTKQVEEIAWATAAPQPAANQEDSTAAGGAPAAPQKFTGAEVVGIALGNFQPDVIDAFFKQQKLPTVTVRGYTLYAFGSGVSPGDLFFFFLDANTLAFGHRDPLEALIEVHYGDAESFLANDSLEALVEEVNGQGTMWEAMDADNARETLNRLMPTAAQFPGANQILARVKGVTVTVGTDPGMELRVTPLCASAEDALTLAQVLQAGLLYKRYQVSQKDPDMAQVIDGTSVSADGDHLKIHIQIGNDLLLSLLHNNAFYSPM
ncbi:MAG TPA: hypothetical protein VLW54_00685 [Candidatus Acidoferrales bacterium]|nr:hypothetical protein [Candidatus Acidoferrales bacterium]